MFRDQGVLRCGAVSPDARQVKGRDQHWLRLGSGITGRAAAAATPVRAPQIKRSLVHAMRPGDAANADLRDFSPRVPGY
jgi:hypothetical protein